MPKFSTLPGRLADDGAQILFEYMRERLTVIKGYKLNGSDTVYVNGGRDPSHNAPHDSSHDSSHDSVQRDCEDAENHRLLVQYFREFLQLFDPSVTGNMNANEAAQYHAYVQSFDAQRLLNQSNEATQNPIQQSMHGSVHGNEQRGDHAHHHCNDNEGPNVCDMLVRFRVRRWADDALHR